MWGFDFDIFWRASRALLQGQSPYVVGGFFSPYPVALVLLPFALLPFGLAFGLWTALKLFLLARAGDRQQFIKAVLFFPVVFDLLQGQLDLLVFTIAMTSSWVGVVVSTLRPQLAVWIVPFSAWHWWANRRYDQFWKAALGVVALYGISSAIEPTWWPQWFGGELRAAWQYNGQSASLFGLTSVLPFSHNAVFAVVSLLAAMSFILLRPQTPRRFWQLVALFNPVANVYSLVVLFDQADWVAIVLGLAVLPLSLVAHTNAVWALIPLYLLLKDRFGPALADRLARAPNQA